MKEKEVWKKIENHPKYEVSTLGRVRRLGQENVLKPWSGKTSIYLMLCLRDKTNLKKKVLVHRLVLQTFLPNSNYQMLEVNHKDGNKLNNNLNNLEWVTRQENVNHSVEYKLNCRGSDHGNSKLTEGQVVQIKALLKLRKSKRCRPYYSEIAKEFNVDRKTIENIQKGKGWRHVK